MDEFKNINDRLIMESVQSDIRDSLKSHIGTTDLEAVRKTLANCLNQYYNQELIEPNFKVGRCGQLWSLWTFRQKLKWYFYNKTPIIKDLSDQIRKGIDDYNELLVDPETHEYTSIPKEYPEYLNPSPKSIIIVDTQVKLNQGIDFITIDVTLGEQ